MEGAQVVSLHITFPLWSDLGWVGQSEVAAEYVVGEDFD